MILPIDKNVASWPRDLFLNRNLHMSREELLYAVKPCEAGALECSSRLLVHCSRPLVHCSRPLVHSSRLFYHGDTLTSRLPPEGEDGKAGAAAKFVAVLEFESFC